MSKSKEESRISLKMHYADNRVNNNNGEGREEMKTTMEKAELYQLHIPSCIICSETHSITFSRQNLRAIYIADR